MNAILILILFNAIVLMIAFKMKKFLYTVTPEKQWEKNIKEFDANIKAIHNLDLSDYKLGSDHMYKN